MNGHRYSTNTLRSSVPAPPPRPCFPCPLFSSFSLSLCITWGCSLDAIVTITIVQLCFGGKTAESSGSDHRGKRLSDHHSDSNFPRHVCCFFCCFSSDYKPQSPLNGKIKRCWWGIRVHTHTVVGVPPGTRLKRRSMSTCYLLPRPSLAFEFLSHFHSLVTFA